MSPPAVPGPVFLGGPLRRSAGPAAHPPFTQRRWLLGPCTSLRRGACGRAARGSGMAAAWAAWACLSSREGSGSPRGDCTASTHVPAEPPVGAGEGSPCSPWPVQTGPVTVSPPRAHVSDRIMCQPLAKKLKESYSEKQEDQNSLLLPSPNLIARLPPPLRAPILA